MFNTYLRGFVRPDYPQGRQSKIRELVLCRAIDREQQGDSLVAAAQANMELLAGLPVKNGPDFLRLHNEALRMMVIGYDLRQQHPAGEINESLHASVSQAPLERMAELLEVLKASDIRGILPIP